MPYTDPADRGYELPDPGITPFTLARAINTWLRESGALPMGHMVWGVCALTERFMAHQSMCFDLVFDVLYAFRIAEEHIQHHPMERAIMDCSRLEFYRRIVAPYEDMKRDLNGDVW